MLLKNCLQYGVGAYQPATATATAAATASLAPAARTSLLAPTVPVRTGANLKELRIRIKSVASIKKITESMKLVAAAKSRSARVLMEQVRPFASTLAAPFDAKEGASLYRDDDKCAKTLFVLVTSDRGLCGPINSSVIKYYKKAALEASKANKTTIVACIGDKARSTLMRSQANEIIVSGSEIGKRATPFADVADVVDEVMKHEFDRLTVVSNTFVSPMLFELRTTDFPSPKDFVENGLSVFKNVYDVDESVHDFLPELYSYHLSAHIYSAIVENQAVELASRQNSMDNATKNADGMVKSLTLVYNKKRQAAITTELTEIISGAEGLKSAQDD